jgi:hypothetical protein
MNTSKKPFDELWIQRVRGNVVSIPEKYGGKN